jgi:hypothetical protein
MGSDIMIMQSSALQVFVISGALVAFDILLWLFPDQYFAMRAISLKLDDISFRRRFEMFNFRKKEILPISILFAVAIALQALSIAISFFFGFTIAAFTAIAILSMVITTAVVVNAFNRAMKQLEA